ncbi:hypothetical protein IW150_006692, partial [Coemansia sp. RSA 2607]
DDGKSPISVELISDDDDGPGASDADSDVRVWKTETLNNALPSNSRLPPTGSYAVSGSSNSNAKAKGKQVKRSSTSARMKRYVIGDDEREEEENME